MEGFTWLRITESQKLSSSHVCVGELVLTDDGNGDADVTFYDGVSDDDPVIFTFKTAKLATNSVIFQPYLVTERGLYIKVGSNVNELLILFSVGTE